MKAFVVLIKKSKMISLKYSKLTHVLEEVWGTILSPL